MLFRIDVSKIIKQPSFLRIFTLKSKDIVLVKSTLNNIHLIQKYKQNFNTLDLTNKKNYENYNLFHKYQSDKSKYNLIKKFDQG